MEASKVKMSENSESVSHSVVPSSWRPHGQAPLSMGFSRQEYWSGLPFPSPGDLPDAEVEHVSLNVSCIGRQEFD